MEVSDALSAERNARQTGEFYFGAFEEYQICIYNRVGLLCAIQSDKRRLRDRIPQKRPLNLNTYNIPIMVASDTPRNSMGMGANSLLEEPDAWAVSRQHLPTRSHSN
jgi:hypothetical protein